MAMDGARWRRLKELFGEALERSAEERSVFLHAACAGDEELRRQVEGLLAAHDGAGEFLESPVASVGASAPGGTPGRIGPYQLLTRIGDGGMGSVYLAARVDQEFDKLVALKVIRRGMDTEQVVGRFRKERQILASLVHPNIAMLLDGGTTVEGLPYFVMEHVDGEPIDRHCDARRLSLRQRLELFLAVCSAVQCAHRRLVVHRDLKPGNVLVTAEGVVKLLDFGIAKLLDPSEGSAEQTSAPDRFATPAYASPEQLRGDPVTTAGDVYSLGALLYLLLTGCRAHAGGDAAAQVRAVLEREPTPPSEAALAPEEQDGRPAPAARSALRGTTPARLKRLLEGDLDTVVLKAMRREPEQRYASVEQLSEDVRRHLAGLPVLARRAGLWYSARKFAARNRLAVAAAALALVSAVGGFVETTRQRALAERRFEDVRELAHAFLFEFHDAIRDLPGSTRARELVVKRAVEYLDRMALDAQRDRGLQRELAAGFQRLSEIQNGVGSNLGDSRGARQCLEKALAIRRTLAAETGLAADVEALAHVEFALGAFLTDTGDLAGAEESFASSARRVRALLDADPGPPDRRGMLAAVTQQLGYTQGLRGERAAALDSLRRAVAVGEAYCAAHPDSAGARANLAFALDNLAGQLVAAGDARAGLDQVRRARGLQEPLMAAEPHNARYRRDFIETLETEAACQRALGDEAAALRSLADGLARAQAQLAADPANRWNGVTLLRLRRLLGTARIEAGEEAAGVELLRQAAGDGERLAAADPEDAFSRNELVSVYTGLGTVVRRGASGAPAPASAAEGCELLRRAAALREELRRAGKLFRDNEPPPADVEAAQAGCAGR